jgi:hypothetical protein
MPHVCHVCTRPLRDAPWRYLEGRDQAGVHWVCPVDENPPDIARAVEQHLRRLSESGRLIQ